MTYIYKNIKGTEGTSQVIYDIVNTTAIVSSISIANVHDSNHAMVNLFIFRRPTVSTTERFYIIKNLEVLTGTTVVLEEDEIGYDPKVHMLYIEVKSRVSEVDVKLTIK
jgi:hypothetical protein